MKRFLLIVSLLFGSFYQEYALAVSEDDEEISDDETEDSQNDEEDASSVNDYVDDEEDIDEEQKQRHIDNIVDNLVGIEGNNVSRARGDAANKLMSENERLKDEIKKLKKELAQGGKSVKVASRGSAEDDYEERPAQKSKKRRVAQNASRKSVKKGSWKRLRQHPKRTDKATDGPSKKFFTIKNLSSIKNVRAYVPDYSQNSVSWNTSTAQGPSAGPYMVKSFATGEKIPFESYSPSATVKQDYFSQQNCNGKCR